MKDPLITVWLVVIDHQPIYNKGNMARTGQLTQLY